MISLTGLSHLGKRISLLLITLLLPSVALIAQKVGISSNPDWVINNEPDLAYKLSANEISGGFYYLLVDKQENISTKTVFRRLVVKIVNSQGIQSMSDISTEFDPKFQKLSFNHVRIIRNGNVINKLNGSSVKTIQRESEMERFSYDGRLTALINLTDVRQGDVIDYAYTITGYNPIMHGHYADELYFDYTLPVHCLYQRLLSPATQKLNFKYSGNEFKPVVSRLNGLNEYVWKADNVKALVYENNIPLWYNEARRVIITDFDNWNDVVQWILPDFTIPETELIGIKKELGNIVYSKSVDEQIVEAIRFVQDDIRYLAFESGLNAYVPNPPTRVLSHRYGDCKDKSLLLVAILKSLGVKAAPVLVNSLGTNPQAEVPASPLAFNHCIVQIYHENLYWYVDPTIARQGGVSATIYAPHYGEGLVLREGVEGLVRISTLEFTKTLIKSTFNVDSIGGSARLVILSTFEGEQADLYRAFFDGNSLDDISRNYIDFYDDTYPGIISLKNPSYEDDRDKNIFKVQEEYFIENFWQHTSDSKTKISCSFLPLSLRSVLQAPGSPDRKMPLALMFPANITEQIEIILPTPWVLESANYSVDQNGFFYSYSSALSGNTINLNYVYTSKLPYVEASEASNVSKEFTKILNGLSGIELTYDSGISTTSGFSLWMLLLTVAIAAVGIYFARKIYFTYNLKSRATTFLSREIGGWLILVTIGLIVSLLVNLYSLFSTTQFFDSSTLQIILNNSSDRSFFWGIIILGELTFNVLYLIFIGLLLMLLFKRRTIFQRLIIVFYAVTFFWTLFDYLIVDLYLDSADKETANDIFRNFLVAAIWIPYFIMSVRVRETFVVEIQVPGKNTEQNPQLPLPADFSPLEVPQAEADKDIAGNAAEISTPDPTAEAQD